MTVFTHKGYSEAWYSKIARNLDPRWFGVTVVKHPIDLFQYAAIIHETRPDLVIETGTFAGGSALYLAHLCDIADNGRVLSIDLKTDRELPGHPRIDYIAGLSSTDAVTVSHVAKHADGNRCMVILDSAHGADHVYAELDAYSRFVAKGCYLIVEDGNPDGYFLGHGDIVDGQGPAEALKRWEPSNKGFEADRSRECMGFSQNPAGYLRRVRVNKRKDHIG